MSVISLLSEDEDECIIVETDEEEDFLEQTHQLFIGGTRFETPKTSDEILPHLNSTSPLVSPAEDKLEEDAHSSARADLVDIEEEGSTSSSSIGWEIVLAPSDSPSPKTVLSDNELVLSTQGAEGKCSTSVKQLVNYTPKNNALRSSIRQTINSSTRVNVDSNSVNMQHTQQSKIQFLAERLFQVLKNSENPIKYDEPSKEAPLLGNLSNVEQAIFEVSRETFCIRGCLESLASREVGRWKYTRKTMLQEKLCNKMNPVPKKQQRRTRRCKTARNVLELDSQTNSPSNYVVHTKITSTNQRKGLVTGNSFVLNTEDQNANIALPEKLSVNETVTGKNCENLLCLENTQLKSENNRPVVCPTSDERPVYSPPSREKFNHKLKFTVDKSSGNYHVSVVSPMEQEFSGRSPQNISCPTTAAEFHIGNITSTARDNNTSSTGLTVGGLTEMLLNNQITRSNTSRDNTPSTGLTVGGLTEMLLNNQITRSNTSRDNTPSTGLTAGGLTEMLLNNQITRSNTSSVERLEHSPVVSEEPSAIQHCNSANSIIDSPSIESCTTFNLNDVIRLKTGFVECYNITFDESGEYICTDMGDLLLLSVKEARDYQSRVISANKLNCEQLQRSEITIAMGDYRNILKQYRCNFVDLFTKIITKILNAKISVEQYKALLIAWFLKIFLRASTQCGEGHPDFLHEVKANVITLLPESNIHIPFLYNVLACSDAEFERDCCVVLDLMRYCFDANGDRKFEGKSVSDNVTEITDAQCCEKSTTSSNTQSAEHNLSFEKHLVTQNGSTAQISNCQDVVETEDEAFSSRLNNLSEVPVTMEVNIRNYNGPEPTQRTEASPKASHHSVVQQITRESSESSPSKHASPTPDTLSPGTLRQMFTDVPSKTMLETITTVEKSKWDMIAQRVKRKHCDFENNGLKVQKTSITEKKHNLHKQQNVNTGITNQGFTTSTDHPHPNIPLPPFGSICLGISNRAHHNQPRYYGNLPHQPRDQLNLKSYVNPRYTYQSTCVNYSGEIKESTIPHTKYMQPPNKPPLPSQYNSYYYPDNVSSIVPPVVHPSYVHSNSYSHPPSTITHAQQLNYNPHVNAPKYNHVNSEFERRTQASAKGENFPEYQLQMDQTESLRICHNANTITRNASHLPLQDCNSSGVDNSFNLPSPDETVHDIRSNAGVTINNYNITTYIPSNYPGNMESTKTDYYNGTNALRTSSVIDVLPKDTFYKAPQPENQQPQQHSHQVRTSNIYTANLIAQPGSKFKDNSSDCVPDVISRIITGH